MIWLLALGAVLVIGFLTSTLSNDFNIPGLIKDAAVSIGPGLTLLFLLFWLLELTLALVLGYFAITLAQTTPIRKIGVPGIALTYVAVLYATNFFGTLIDALGWRIPFPVEGAIADRLSEAIPPDIFNWQETFVDLGGIAVNLILLAVFWIATHRLLTKKVNV